MEERKFCQCCGMPLDKPAVMAAIAEKTASGLYPDNLWEVRV